MESYQKNYIDFFEIDEYNQPIDELTGSPANDLHHIFGRVYNEHMEMLGIPDPDDVRNVMALTRFSHIYYGQKTEHNLWLYQEHCIFMERKLVLRERGPHPEHFVNFMLDFIKARHNSQFILS